MDFLAHAVAERRVNQLVALHPIAALERPADDHRLEMLAIANDFEVLAGEPAADSLLHAFWRNHVDPLQVESRHQVAGRFIAAAYTRS